MKISSKLDLVVALVLSILGVLILFLSWYAKLLQYDIGLILFFSPLIYILFKNRFFKESFDNSKNTNNMMIQLLNLVFIAVYTLSIVLLYFNLYHRPLSYFILISLLSSFIVIEIVHLKVKASSVPILLKIIMLSLNIRYGIFYEFSSLIGNDLFKHAKLINQVMSSGFVTPETMDYTKYFDFPIYHILNASLSLVSSFDIKSSLFFSTVFFFSVSTVYIYLIGKKLVGVKFGLLAMLLANVSDVFIVAGLTSITPGSLVFCWLLILLYLLLTTSNSVSNNFIKILLIAVLILTHQLSTLASLVILISIFVGERIFAHIHGNLKLLNMGTLSTTLSINSLLIFGVMLIFYWMHADKDLTSGKSFFYFAINPVVNVFKYGDFLSHDSNVYADYYAQYSMASNVLFHLGYLILIGLAIIGALIWLSSKAQDSQKFSIIVATFSLYIFIYGAPLTGIGNAQLSTRWLVFAYLFLILLSTQTIFSLVNSLNSKRTATFVLITIIFTFTMITTPYVNGDSPLYCQERWPRASFTDSEVQASRTIADTCDGIVNTDGSYSILFREFSYNCSIKGINETDSESLNQNVVLLRECITKEPVVMEWKGGELGIVKIVEDKFLSQFQTSRHDLIYDNYYVKAYSGKTDSVRDSIEGV